MKITTHLSLLLGSTGLIFLSATPKAKALSLTYDSQIGSPGLAPAELFLPQGVAKRDADSNIYVANGPGQNPDGSFNPDFGNSIEVFSPDGTYLRSIASGAQGKGAGLNLPADLGFNPITGNLYVSDSRNSEIDVYDPDSGEFLTSFGSFSGPRPGAILSGPAGLNFDRQGNLYVGDITGNQVQVYDISGKLVETLEEITVPSGIAVSSQTGNIYVNELGRNRVQVFDEDANFLFAFGEEGSEPGQFREPVGIALDEFENIYIADSQNNRVQAFDRNANFLASFGQPALDDRGEVVPPPLPGSSPFGNPLDLREGRFNLVIGLDYSEGQLLAGDFYQGRVQVLNTEERTLRSVPEPHSLISLVLIVFGAAFTRSKVRT